MERKFFQFLLLTISMTIAIFFYKIATIKIPDPNGFPILEYHMITANPDETSRIYSVPPEIFAEQMDFLIEHGYQTITIRDYIRASHGEIELPMNPIILTFDDGYSDNYSDLFPILKSRNMVAVIFVVSNLVGQPGYLTWDQIREMQSYGIEIGCHGANHISIENLSDESRRHEIIDSKKFLQYNGIYNVISFSYPNGKYDQKSLELIFENYSAAVTGDAGLNNFSTDPILLQRTNIPLPKFESTAVFEFELRLKKCSAYTFLNIHQHQK